MSRRFFFFFVMHSLAAAVQEAARQQLLLLQLQHLFAVRMSSSAPVAWHGIISSCQRDLCCTSSGHNWQLSLSLLASLLITFAYFCVRIDNSKSKSKRLPPAHVAGQEFIDNATSSIMAIRLQTVSLAKSYPEPLAPPPMLLHVFCIKMSNVVRRLLLIT